MHASLAAFDNERKELLSKAQETLHSLYVASAIPGGLEKLKEGMEVPKEQTPSQPLQHPTGAAKKGTQHPPPLGEGAGGEGIRVLNVIEEPAMVGDDAHKLRKNALLKKHRHTITRRTESGSCCINGGCFSR